jgi:metal-responsive CopG/Arc/MetJ family transcriptional regulator
MQITLEIDDKMIEEIDAVAKSFNTNRFQYISETLEIALKKDSMTKKRSDAEKVKKFVESYEKYPQMPEEYEVWEDEQVWED